MWADLMDFIFLVCSCVLDIPNCNIILIACAIKIALATIFNIDIRFDQLKWFEMF